MKFECSINATTSQFSGNSSTFGFAVDVNWDARNSIVVQLIVDGPGGLSTELLLAAANQSLVVDANPLGLIWRALGIRLDVEDDKHWKMSGALVDVAQPLLEYLMVANSTEDTSLRISVAYNGTECYSSSLYYSIR